VTREIISILVLSICNTVTREIIDIVIL
jgi:hypothetical protein